MKKIAIVITVLFSFTLVGCWDSVETEELGIVSIMGFKLVNNEIEVTIEELSNKGQTSGIQTLGSKTPFYVFSASGLTVSEALQKISANQHQKLYFAHTKVLIADEDFALSKGIQPIIDFCMRTPEMRLTMRLLVSKHGVLDKIFSIKNFDIDLGTLLEEKMNNKTSISIYNIRNIEGIIELTNEPGNISHTSGIEVSSTTLNKTSATNEFNVTDTAIFNNCKLIGWLNDEESVGLACVSEKTSETIFTVQFKDKSVSLKTIKMNSKIKPQIIDGKMQINIITNVTSNVIESDGNCDFTDSNNIKMLEHLLSIKIKEEIIASIEESKKAKIDVFGFGNYINMYFHSYWDNVQNNWNSYYYPDIKVNITVNSIIKNVGKVFRTLH